MTRSDLYISISGIDDELLERSEIAQRAHAPRFRRVPFALIAAIIAMLLMGAAGIIKIYTLVTGFSIEQIDIGFHVDSSTAIAPAVLKDGRLWFTADGQRIDITDQIDNDTPFIYTTVNPRTNEPAYIIIGGTPENFGYVEVWKSQGRIGFAGRYGRITTVMDITQEEFNQGIWIPVVEDIKGKWLYNAIKELEPEL